MSSPKAFSMTSRRAGQLGIEESVGGIGSFTCTGLKRPTLRPLARIDLWNELHSDCQNLMVSAGMALRITQTPVAANTSAKRLSRSASRDIKGTKRYLTRITRMND